MKDLDRNKVYSLGAIKKDEVKLNQLKEWLIKNDKDWDNGRLYNIKNFSYITYNNLDKEWYCSDSEDNSICALTLFEEDFNPNTVIEVSNDGESWLKRVLVDVKNNKAICWYGSETIEESKRVNKTAIWKYYRNIQPEKSYEPKKGDIVKAWDEDDTQSVYGVIQEIDEDVLYLYKYNIGVCWCVNVELAPQDIKEHFENLKK